MASLRASDFGPISRLVTIETGVQTER